MSAQHPNIVYLGDVDAGRRLLSAAEPLDWGVFLPAEAFEALGMVIAYLPDAVILDLTARPTTAVEVYHHLRTLTGGCPPIIAVTGEADAPGWTDPGRYALPRTDAPADLMAAVRTVVERNESIWE